mgnify:CR=1 FL=1|jgi:hypothetical protein
MPSDLDILMSRMEEINSKSATELTPSDIDTVIEYHRAQRARRAAGEKAPKTKTSVDISTIMTKLTAKPAAEPIKRRI